MTADSFITICATSAEAALQELDERQRLLDNALRDKCVVAAMQGLLSGPRCPIDALGRIDLERIVLDAMNIGHATADRMIERGSNR